MRYVRLFGGIFVVSLKQTLAHRADFLFQTLLTASGIAAGIAALGLVYARTETLAGWGLGEATVVLGTYQIASGALATFVEPNLAWFAERVKTGKLDDLLLQPVPSILLASLGRCNALALGQSGLGMAVVAIGLTHARAAPTPGGVAGWLVLLCVGLAVAWAPRLLLASLAFWAPHVEPDVLYGAFWQLGRYPVAVYRQPVRGLLTYVIPIASIATVPARVLTRGADGALLLGSLAAALGIVVLVRLVWSAGLRRYTSATS